MRALALTLMLLPSVALAQPAPPVAPTVPAPISPAAAPSPPALLPASPDPDECTVTTTVRCTGAAAPYAVQAAQPQPPVVIQAPAPIPPPAPHLLPPPAGAVIIDPRQLGDGWHVAQSPDGCLWRERKVSTDAPVVWGTGMAFWLGGYTIGVIAGSELSGLGLAAWWPIVGAFLNAGFNDSDSAKALWAVDGIAQVGGFVTFLVGLAAGPDKLERLPLTFGPARFVGGGGGVALAGRF